MPRLLLALLALGLPHPLLLAQTVGESVVVRGSHAQDLYLAGRSVEVPAAVAGDVTAAGASVAVDGDISQDLIAAGGTVTVRGRVGDDARLAGGEIRVNGRVGDDLIAAGGRVSLARGAGVGGRAWLAGGEVEVLGTVGGELRASAGEFVLGGEIAGDAEVLAESLTLRPGAVIRGDLSYRSPQPAQIAEGAQILGAVRYQAIEDDGAAARYGAGALALVSLMVTAIVLYLLFPRFSVAAARTIQAAPWKSLGLGLAVLAATPLVVVLLMASFVGLWLGLILLALYLIALLAGFLTGVLFLADAGLRLLRRRADTSRGLGAVALAAALLVLALLGSIPVLGALLLFLVLLLGLGALDLRLWRRYAGTE